MNVNDEETRPSGEFIKSSGLVYKDGKQTWSEYTAFLPNPLPPVGITYGNDVLLALSDAIMTIGELKITAGKMSPFLISGIAKASIKKEAQLSSRIEGTIVPTADLLLFEPRSSTANPADIREVQNFDRAQTLAIADIKEGRPLSQHLMKTIHGQLMAGVRGEQWHPGEYRTLQNMIGYKRDINTARFIPPPVEMMGSLMDNLFEFIAGQDGLAPLIKIGIAHYQFEAIHPFEDGNGRLGRLLIILMLINYKLMDQPLIYPSAYFDTHQEEYRDRLLHISKHGDWCGWLVFFLEGVKNACEVAIRRCTRFTALIDEAKDRIRRPQATQNLFDLIDLFANEFVLTSKMAAEKLEISYQNARIYFHRLEAESVISKIGSKKRNASYYLKGVWQILED